MDPAKRFESRRQMGEGARKIAFGWESGAGWAAKTL